MYTQYNSHIFAFLLVISLNATSSWFALCKWDGCHFEITVLKRNDVISMNLIISLQFAYRLTVPLRAERCYVSSDFGPYC